jgi:tetratricopeptide (TPR) repeat protein
MSKVARCTLVTVIALLGVIAPARADDGSRTASNATEELARQAVRRGFAAFARRDAEAALAEYRKATELVPTANLPYRYAAEALVELERYEEAITSYERYLALKPDVSDAPEIRVRIEAAREKRKGTVRVVSSPAGALVFVDGTAVSGIRTPAMLDLQRGVHSIVLKLPAHQNVTLTPRVLGGDSQDLSCTLPVLAGMSVSSHRTSSLAGGALLAGGLALTAVTFAVDAFVLRPMIADFDAQRSTGNSEALDTQRNAATMQAILLGSYIASAVLSLAGTVLLAWPKHAR